ncbi:MAG: 16S rRNA (cytosine(1402)-N(4))-methyltransferase RsmH [Propionibacteriaceae bacterium]|jgi:16S rRNA (cytosine1402-N4)-methyltransferase|nr:16S rRNA (cytosine(1402)-N(4))-methyltransferase RsmH [Propionibacteriaceae bacterium]
MAAFSADHIPVMRTEVVEYLSPALAKPSVYVDGTLGLAGHARAILEANPEARLIGIDRDPQALDIAAERLLPYKERVSLHHAVFSELPDVLARENVEHVEAMLLDLGLSSLQIDNAERGFAYMAKAPLDMRMDQSTGRSAADIVNTASETALAQLLRELGDEKFAGRIARSIVAVRNQAPIETTNELVDVIVHAIPRGAETGGHPAKRTFQALRIAVNSELDALRLVLPAALDALAVGGRLAVLAYHSGEDRMVKQAFQEAVSDHAPKDLPVVPDELKATHKLLTRGAQKPTEAEVKGNPRAASARLRVVERTRS